MHYLLREQTAGHMFQLANTATSPLADDWKTRAIAAYQQHRQHEGSALRRALAQRVHALTGHALDEAGIWVDLDERRALATVDGIRFQLGQSQLVILRSCALCGSGQFASPPLTSQADVGFALSAWHPHHPQCQPDDPASW